MTQIDTLQQQALANGETITYRQRPGGNELIVLVHGNMTSSKHWDLLMESFDERFTVFAVDMRGFGGSTYNQRIASIKDFSDDIKLWADALQLQKFTIIGWSTGGNVAMQFCADYPNLAKKLVLFASGSTRGYPFYGSYADGTPNSNDRYTTLAQIEADPLKTIPIQQMYAMRNKEALQFVWNSAIYTHNQPEKEHYDAYVEDMLTQRNYADVAHALNIFNISAVDNEVSVGTNEVAAIQLPTLVLYGDRDYVVPAAMTQEIIEDFEGRAQVYKLENCGHSPIIDNLAETTNAIETFILT